MRIKIFHQEILTSDREFEQACNDWIENLKDQYEIVDIKFSSTLDSRISSDAYSSIMIIYKEVE